jgi:hypothetical protein
MQEGKGHMYETINVLHTSDVLQALDLAIFSPLGCTLVLTSLP